MLEATSMPDNGERRTLILPDDVDCAHPIERWVHVTFDKDNGGVGDSYDCGVCDALMQVG